MSFLVFMGVWCAVVTVAVVVVFGGGFWLARGLDWVSQMRRNEVA